MIVVKKEKRKERKQKLTKKIKDPSKMGKDFPTDIKEPSHGEGWPLKGETSLRVCSLRRFEAWR